VTYPRNVPRQLRPGGERCHERSRDTASTLRYGPNDSNVVTRDAVAMERLSSLPYVPELPTVRTKGRVPAGLGVISVWAVGSCRKRGRLRYPATRASLVAPGH